MYKKHFTSTALPRLRDAPRPILHRALPIRHLHLGYRRRKRIASAFIPAVLRASRLRRGWRRQPLILETQSAPRRIHLPPRTLHARRGGVLLHGRGRGRRGVGVVRRRCGRHPLEHHSNGVVLRERWRCDRDQSRGSVRVGASGVFQTSESAARHRGRAGPSRCTLTGGISRKMAGEMGAEGAETGARGVVRGEVRLPARWCAVSRVALVLARLDDVSARRKVAPWKLRDQEGNSPPDSGRARCSACPREEARPTNRVLPSTARF